MNPWFLNRYRVSDNGMFSIFFFFDRLKQMLCNKTKLLLGRCYTKLCNRDREPPKEQSTGKSKSNLMNQWVYLGLFMEIWVKSYLQKQKRLKESCVSKAHPRVTAHKSWQSGAHSAAYRLEHVLSKRLGVYASSSKFCWFLLLSGRVSSVACLLWGL